MMPAEFMAAAVAMLADTFAQFDYFSNKLFPRHLDKIVIHF
jgi:hypothetical protein